MTNSDEADRPLSSDALTAIGEEMQEIERLKKVTNVELVRECMYLKDWRDGTHPVIFEMMSRLDPEWPNRPDQEN